jgi:[ribosomal protein S5]-alanine N-acetyltransferase
MDDIETPRLLLRIIEPAALRAGIAGDRRAVELSLGATVPADLIAEPDVLRHAEARLGEDVEYLPWSARAILLKESRRMVGHVRFHSRPDADYLHPYVRHAVEFGYVVFADCRRRGYAEEALGGLMRWASETRGVARFVATIAPDNQPSTRLAAKLGFKRIGEDVDPVDGIEYVYLLDLSGRP